MKTYRDFREENKEMIEEIRQGTKYLLDCDMRPIRNMVAKMSESRDSDLYKLLHGRGEIKEDTVKFKKSMEQYVFVLSSLRELEGRWRDEGKSARESLSWLLRALISDESLKDSHTQSQAKKILKWLESKVELSMEKKNED